MADDPGTDGLDTALADAFGALLGQMGTRLEKVARRFELPPFCVKALHMLGSPLAMKELGQRFGCDPSFVTAIADVLHSHGLGVREPDPRDRRIKHLRLTEKGAALREQVERELFDGMPWNQALDPAERQCLLGHLRKMVGAAQDQSAAAGSCPAEEMAKGPSPRVREHRAGEVTAQFTSAASGGS
jgi:DNA-binding MarR family transcriptional regulator